MVKPAGQAAEWRWRSVGLADFARLALVMFDLR